MLPVKPMPAPTRISAISRSIIFYSPEEARPLLLSRIIWTYQLYTILAI